MEVRARTKNLGVSPRKLRHIVDAVRGLHVEDALDILKFTPSPAAQIVAKTVNSAASNAENNFQLIRNELRIKRIYADDAPRLKRFRPRPRGRAAPIYRRFSHLTVVVDDEVGEE